jgi:exo-beta-1,3-glucanase (GH17 family)
MRRLLLTLAVTVCAGVAVVVLGVAASADAAAKVRTCGKVIASGGGPPSAMPRLTVTVQGGSVSCKTADTIIHDFQSLITAHAHLSGYACKQVNTAGDERCVKGKTVIKGTYPG